ncbi:hypothetical protein G2W53_003925 [Senna tora]|uniref:Uncharacterized protein n=1 Tax=Senna tora TaxID=362788 RepID=A0A834XBY2_9FABA|nr:hypothetical protein G2W53_003925 [Senna tora]
MIMCSWANDTQTFQVKTFNDKHTCSMRMTAQQASSKWLAVKMLPFLRSNSKLDGNDIITYIQETFSLIVTPTKAYRACRRGKIIMEGSEKDKYKRLRDYAWEILRSNPGSTCKIGVHRISPTLPPTLNRSTTMQEFKCNMSNLKEFNKKAGEFLSRIPPKQ